ncbi:MAG TPA: zf-HC2 domain-containing protein [Candidatus Acidoferrum sp.]|nr:zf-HC2 domain-containing protein [Candidatus Acidoferrum sp.]
MNCSEARERILDNLDGSLAAADQELMQRHISDCDACAHFAEAQRALDRKLTKSLIAPALDPTFEKRLRARLAPHPREQWASWLPDVAYASGTVVAVILCVLLLPLSATVVVPVAAGIAIISYVVQAIFAGILEEASR